MLVESPSRAVINPDLDAKGPYRGTTLVQLSGSAPLVKEHYITIFASFGFGPL